MENCGEVNQKSKALVFIYVTKELSYVMLELHNVKMKLSNVRKKKKGAIKCDKRTITCDIGTAQYENETIKCEDLVTWYSRSPTNGYHTPKKKS